MNYTDLNFLYFFLITTTIYYFCRSVLAQVSVIVIASLVFYAWESPALLTLFLSCWFITAFTSHKIINAKEGKGRLLNAWLGVLFNLGLLGFFKYKFLVISPADITGNAAIDWLIHAPLPIGISFYTFHGISLLIDCYRGAAAFDRSKGVPFGTYARDTLLYLVFFPQLIAGPIIKAKEFYPQVTLKRFKDIDWPGVARIMILGYFLKTVIADNLQDQTTWISYPHFLTRSPVSLVALLYGYSAQIFADFAGYSLIAIGLGKILGYNLPQNFNFPYFAESVGEFWRKWHISLSSWLRDYLYIPLGGSRNGPARTYFALFMVMFLGGLWHGAAWSFAVWGTWHGLGLALERPWRDSFYFTSQHRFMRYLRIFVVFNFVAAGWLLFKLQEFSHAVLYVKTFFSGSGAQTAFGELAVLAAYSSTVLFYHMANASKEVLSRNVKDVLYGVMLFFILLNRGAAVPFIYFQF